MGFTRLQVAVLLGAATFFSVLYFGCPTKSPKQKSAEISRQLSNDGADMESMIPALREKLPAALHDNIEAIEKKLAAATADTSKNRLLKQISGAWFRAERPDVAGFYAEKVAEMEKTEESWSIAGSTYFFGVQGGKDETMKTTCTARAIKSFENAASLNPKNTANKVQLALCYVENPPKDNPMKGILLLRDLNEQDPNNVQVLNTLGRLAIKTGQFDKAIERLGKAVSLEPKSMMSNCLLADAYNGKGDAPNANKYGAICKKLTK
jgi:predicted Zn-dependent protease